MTDKIVCESLEGAIKRQHAGEQFDFIISIGDTQDPRDHVDGNGRVFSFAFEDTCSARTIVAELFKINPFALPHEDFLQWIDSEFDFGGWLVELVEEKTKEVMNNKFTI